MINSLKYCLIYLLVSCSFYLNGQVVYNLNIDLDESESKFTKDNSGTYYKSDVWYVPQGTQFNFQFKTAQNSGNILVTLTSNSALVIQNHNSKLYSQTFQTSQLLEWASSPRVLLDKDQKFEFQLSWKDSKNIKFIKSILVSSEKEELKNTNFLVVGAIRTIAGRKPANDLVDLLFKFKYGPNGRWFTLLGTEISLTDTSGAVPIQLKEAIVNVNYYVNPSTEFQNFNRLGFFGGGFKVFNGNYYAGGHLGSIETGGTFYSSYVLLGFYRSLFDYPVVEKDNTLPTNYRNNIYVEAVINPTKDLSPILAYLRLKFGLIIPVSVPGDIPPVQKDVQFRLAIEVPIGGVFRF